MSLNYHSSRAAARVRAKEAGGFHRSGDERMSRSSYGLATPLLIDRTVVASDERSSTLARAEIEAAGQEMFDVFVGGKAAQLKVGQLNVQILSESSVRKMTKKSSNQKVLQSWLYFDLCEWTYDPPTQEFEILYQGADYVRAGDAPT